MPKRPHVDDARVMAVYTETGSNRETARILGIHENTVITVRRTAAGLCRRCGKNPVLGGPRCESCKVKMATYVRESQRPRKNATGICYFCTKPVAPGLKCCRLHADKRIADGRQSKKLARETRGDEYQALVSEWNRRAHYGQGAVDAWNKTSGACIACGRPYRKNGTHIHHIDGDHANRAESNMAPLCKECHNLLHYLAEWHYDLQAALVWIMNTYPSVANNLRATLTKFDAVKP